MILSTKGLCLEYPDGTGNRKILTDINLNIKEKERVVLVGPSGSGKSSLIYMLSAIKKPTAGKVFLDGDDLSAADVEKIRYGRFGFVFQQHFLIPYLSVFQNVCLAKKCESIKKNARELLNSLGIAKLADKLPHQLSGGERQRVAIARALVKMPDIIFADEPTASLDKDTAVQIYALLRNHSASSTLVMTTHDMSLLHGDERVIRLENTRMV